MAVVSKITPILKTIAGKPLGVASKVLGAAAVASVIYDGHVNGKEKAYSTDFNESSDRFYNNYKQYKTMEQESATLAKAKKIWYDMQEGSNHIWHFGSKTKGYAAGFFSTVVANLPILALSALSLKFKNVGKVAGVALATLGVKRFLYDVAGIGKEKVNNK